MRPEPHCDPDADVPAVPVVHVEPYLDAGGPVTDLVGCWGEFHSHVRLCIRCSRVVCHVKALRVPAKLCREGWQRWQAVCAAVWVEMLPD